MVRSSGGAITSTHRNGSNSTNGNLPPVVVEDEEEQLGNPEPTKDEEKSSSFVANNTANPLGNFTPPRWRAPQAQVVTRQAPKPIAKAIDDVKDVVQQSINTVTGNQTLTGSTPVGRNAFSTLDSLETEDQQQARPGFVAPISIITNVVNAALAPFLNPTPGQPAPQNPILWAVLGWVRRQVQDSPFGKIVLNRTPRIDTETTAVEDNGDGTFTITTPASDPDGDDLTYAVASRDGEGTITPLGEGKFLYDVTATDWDGDDEVTVTVSDAADYPHLHGLASFFRPDGGHTATVTVTIAPDDGSLPEPEVITPPTERPNEPGVYDTKLQYDPGTVSNVSAATGTAAPKYFKVVSESYDPETGEYTAVLKATQAGMIRQGLGLDTEDFLNLQVTEGSSVQTFAMRSASFSTLAEDPPEQALTLPTPPAAHFDVVEQDIPTGVSPAGVVVTDKYVYVISTMFDQEHPPTGQPSRVTVIGADPDAANYNQVVTTIDVPESATFAGLSDNRLYVASSPNFSSTGTITIINTDTNTIMDADENDGESDIDVISVPRGGLNPIMSPDGNRIYLTNFNQGKLYVINTDPTSGADYNTVVAEIPVATLQTQNPDGSTTLQLPISGAFNADGSRLYLVRDTQTITSDGDFTFGGELIVINTEDNTVVGDPIDLGQYGGYAASNGRYLYVPTLDLSDYEGTQPDLADIHGYVTVFDTQGDADNPVLVDLDPNTPETDRLPAGNVPYNIAFSPDGSLAYVVSGGNGTIFVIDTATNELLDLDPDAAGVQGIVFDETPSGQLGDANIIGISPDGKQLYVSNYGDDTVTALEFVEET